jgi:hypothetical protein
MGGAAVGLIACGDEPSRRGDLAFSPFVCGGAQYYRRSEAILANAPWIDLSIIMIRPTHPDRYNKLDLYPAARLLSSASSAGGAKADLSFVVREGGPAPQRRQS